MRIGFKCGFSNGKKVFQKVPTTRYLAGLPRRGQDMLTCPAGSDKQGTQPSFSFAFILLTDLCALRGTEDWQTQGYSHPVDPGGSTGSPVLHTASI